MNILIVEDEARIAKRTERMARLFFGRQLQSIQLCDSLPQALKYISTHTIDVLLLDLNLNGEDGFEILKTFAAGAFHTIIISAYTEKAITAYAYGVLDFVPKPFNADRLDKAFMRLTGPNKSLDVNLQFLAVKKAGSISLIEISQLRYIKGAGIYTELHLQNGRYELHDKSLEKLEQLLPPSFKRIHKSYIVPITQAEKIMVSQGSRYDLLLKNGELLPIGRSRYKALKDSMLSLNG